MISFLKIFAISFLSIQLFTNTAVGETNKAFDIEVDVRGKVTSIQIVGDGSYNHVLSQVMALRLDKSLSDEQVISYLNGNLNTISPLFYLEASHRLCLSDPNKAANWYAAYVVRSIYDGKRCTDKTAGQGFIAAQLSMPMSTECTESIEAELRNNGGLFDRYLEAAHNDKFFSDSASPMWLCSHGINVFVNTIDDKLGKNTSGRKSAIYPIDKWPEIRQEVIEALEAKKRAKASNSSEAVK